MMTDAAATRLLDRCAVLDGELVLLNLDLDLAVENGADETALDEIRKQFDVRLFESRMIVALLERSYPGEGA